MYIFHFFPVLERVTMNDRFALGGVPALPFLTLGL